MSILTAQILPESFNPNFYDALTTHFIQSWRWGIARQQTGINVIRLGFFKGPTLYKVCQITLHAIPKTNRYFGLLSRGPILTAHELDLLTTIGKENKMVAIRIEPNIFTDNSVIDSTAARPWSTLIGNWDIQYPRLKKAGRNYYIPHNFLVDTTKSEENLLAAMDQKTRYNIKVAQKHVVTITDQTNEETLEAFIKLQKLTAKRQKFYIHADDYYRTVYKTFIGVQAVTLLVAKHPDDTILSIWFLLAYQNTLTYLYGASSEEHRDVMANNLMAWEAIKLCKTKDLTMFDFGGTLGLEADAKDPRFGFHKFKKGFGGSHVSYAGSFDLVIDPTFYAVYNVADKLRWWLLRLKK